MGCVVDGVGDEEGPEVILLVASGEEFFNVFFAQRWEGGEVLPCARREGFACLLGFLLVVQLLGKHREGVVYLIGFELGVADLDKGHGAETCDAAFER